MKYLLAPLALALGMSMPLEVSAKERELHAPVHRLLERFAVYNDLRERIDSLEEEISKIAEETKRVQEERREKAVELKKLYQGHHPSPLGGLGTLGLPRSEGLSRAVSVVFPRPATYSSDDLFQKGIQFSSEGRTYGASASEGEEESCVSPLPVPITLYMVRMPGPCEKMQRITALNSYIIRKEGGETFVVAYDAKDKHYFPASESGPDAIEHFPKIEDGKKGDVSLSIIEYVEVADNRYAAIRQKDIGTLSDGQRAALHTNYASLLARVQPQLEAHIQGLQNQKPILERQLKKAQNSYALAVGGFE